MTRDKISQVYLGKLHNHETQRIARSRIDWMCEANTGKTVLDIGCSEGIFAILLARSGFNVLGIDVVDESIHEAQKLLTNEPPEVQDRIRFEVRDLTTNGINSEFDCVNLGEVIEHLDNAKALVEAGFKHLKTSGLMIVTTPFGFFPHDDHKEIYGLANFTELFRPHCQPIHMSIVDGYIRFIGKKEQNTEGEWAKFIDRADFLGLTMNVLIDTQRRYFERTSDQTKKILEARSKRDQHYQTVQDMKMKLTESRQKIEDLSNEKKTMLPAAKKALLDPMVEGWMQTTLSPSFRIGFFFIGAGKLLAKSIGLVRTDLTWHKWIRTISGIESHMKERIQKAAEQTR